VSVAQTLRRTALYDEHVALGARLVPFGGFEMPVQYGGIIREHDAVRERAGLFDLSHMAQFEIEGSQVGEWADRLTVNAVSTMKPLQARYNIFCNARGGSMDDVLFYRLPDRWLLVVNAANANKMWPYLSSHAEAEARLTNRHGERALIALQGPRALAILAPLCDLDLANMPYYTCAEGHVDGVAALVARTGYTGEDGFEIFLDGSDAPRLWRRLIEAGAPLGLEPAGLGARDMLRLEAGMPLYGFELSEDISPLAGGQSWAVKMKKPEFTGKAALAQQLEADDYPRIAGLVLEGRVPARPGYPVYHGERQVGEIRSASVAPSLGSRNIATALVVKEAAAVGTALDVEIRGARHPATVVAMPFYRRPA
jgi:aminomethyltransferase